MILGQTRAEIFDDMRRLLSVVPVFDNTGLIADRGKQPTSSPFPPNSVLAMCLDRAVAKANRYCGPWATSSLITFNVPVQTLSEPYNVNLSAYTSTGNQIVQVRKVYWSTSQTSPIWQPLELTTREEQELNSRNLWNTPVATPKYAWTEGYRLYLSPSPSAAGTIGIYAGIGILAPLTDSDTLQGLPGDYYPVLLDMAVAELASLRMNDMVMEERIKSFLPKAQIGLAELAAFQTKLQVSHNITLTADVGRQPSMQGGR